MAAPPIPEGFVLERPTRRDPWAVLQQEGWVATNGYRTDQDVERIRRQGYTPAAHGAHNRGDGVDLTHPRMTRQQQVRRLRELFGDWPGYRVLDEGHHRHLQLPGWGAAPGTPGTENSGLPPLPEGFELEQRGPIAPDNFVTTSAEAEAPASTASAPKSLGLVADLMASAQTPNGLRAPGNIDLSNRPVVRNPDGSVSTVRSMSFGTDQGEVLIPTVSDDGRLLSDDEAIDLYRRTGRHLGIFNSPEAATSYAERLHEQQEAMVGRRDELEERAAATRAVAADVRRRAPFPTITTREWAEADPQGYDPLNPLNGEVNRGGAVANTPDPQAAARELQELETAFDRGAPEADLVAIVDRLGARGRIDMEALSQAVRQRDADPDRVRPYSTFVPDQTRAAPERPEDREAPGPDATPDEVASWNRRRIATMQPGASITEYHPTINERVGDWAGYAARPVYGDERGAAQFGNRVSDLTWWSGIGALSDTAEYEERRQRALAEGRFLDAQGNELGAQISAAGLIPIVGPGARRLVRGGRSLVDRLLRRGEREVAEEATRAAEGLVQSAPTAASAQPSAGELWRLGEDDLRALLVERRESDADKLVRALGPERAERFRQLDRAQNNTMDTRRADEAGRAMEAEFGNLTPEQERLIYGIGETDAQAEDIAAVLRAHEDVRGGDDADWSAYMAAVGARRLSPQDMAAVLRGEGSGEAQAAFVRLGRAYKNLRDDGVATADIPRRMASALVERAGWRPEQADEIIGGFVREMERMGADRAGAAGRATPRLPTMAMQNETAPQSIIGPSAREIDRIDVNSLPPLPPGYQLEPQIGRVAPLGEQPDPADLANVARSIRPEDVRPVNNTIDSMEEAARANPGTIRDVPDINPRNELAMRSVPTARGQTVRHRGPLDAEAFLRARGGVQDQGGDLRAMGFTNAAREGTGDRALGPIVNRNGLTLDEAGEALAEAGYVPERPTVAEVLDILDNGRRGQRTFHPDDWEELERFDRATEQQGLADAAESRGSRLGQEVGEPIGPDDLDAMQPPAVAYEDLPALGGRVGNINLANIESETDIRRLLSNVEDRFGGFDAARRGSITHAETEALASELGMTADDLLRRRRGQALNAEQALAARQLLAKSSDEVARLAERAIGPHASDVSRAAFSEALLRHAAIHEQVAGATAEAGRTLNALKIAARSRAVSGRIHDAVIEGMGGHAKLEDIAEGILNLQRQGAGPGEANRFAVDAIRPAFRDKLTELWYNWLLSGPQTHAVNILSNAMTATLQLPEQAVASGLGQIRRGYRALRGLDDDFDRVMGSELGPRVVGLMQGAREGLTNGARTFITGEVPDFVTKVESRTQSAISGWKGSVIRTPTRALAAEDEFFKAVARRMELNGLAVRQARREGLRGEELTRRVADLTANPTDDMILRANAYSRYLTFQKPLGRLGQRISATTQEWPWMKLFLPFVRTPTNIFKFAVERSPLALLMRDVRADLKAGGERRALAAARMALGTGVGLTVAELASNGTITGGGPADRNAEAMMRADGWQPYSIRIGDRYYSYQRLDPLALTLGTAADLVDLQDHMTPRQAEEAGAMVMASIISNLSDKTWFSGLSSVMGALNDPDRNLPRFRQRLAGSLAVPAGVAQVARTIDPVQRDVRSILDAVRARIPGLSQTLPARRDIWGREIVNEGGLGPDIASPIWTSTARNDPVTAELLRLGVNIRRPSRSARGGEYAADSYDRLQQFAGQYAHDDLSAAMATPEWRAMSDEDRQKEVRRIVNRARDDARADLQNPEGAPRDFGRMSPGELPAIPEGFELVP